MPSASLEAGRKVEDIMNAYVLMRDGYLDGVVVCNEPINPVKLKALKRKAQRAGLDIFECRTDALSDLEPYLDEEIKERSL